MIAAFLSVLISLFSYFPHLNISPAETYSETSSEQIKSLIDPSDIFVVGGFPVSTIIYTNKNGEKIENFEDIDEHSTAHIFLKTFCYNNWSENKIPEDTVHIQSTSCNKNFCTFPLIYGKTFEEQNEDQLFSGVYTKIYKYQIDPEYRKWFENSSMELSEIHDKVPQYPGWKILKNTLIHPKNGIIPAVFSGGNGC